MSQFWPSKIAFLDTTAITAIIATAIVIANL